MSLRLFSRLPALRASRATPLLARRAYSATPTATPPLTDGEQLLKTKLELALEGARVDVQDVSGGCGSFYAISIAHSSFKGLTMMKQHRLVNGLLKDEIKEMHGLQLKTSAE